MAVIGISCYFHDSAAAIISNSGEILGAAHEERFTRKKHDASFPYNAINYCIKIAKDKKEPIEAYVYYEKPIWVFMRLLETYFSTAPRGFSSFLPAMKTWINKKLFTDELIRSEIKKIDEDFKDESLFFSEHHLSHAASAFYPSNFEKSAILCLDAVGESITTSAWIGNKNSIEPLWEINFPDSIGMLYSSFTFYCGFKVNSGEYKLMGLAPYGKPKYFDLILDQLIDLKEDGSYKLNMKYFKFHRGLRMISSLFISLFGHNPRKPNEEITQFFMDIAASIQKVTEMIVVRMAKDLKKKTNLENLCLSGGVALNCVANGKILEEAGFKRIWIQPSSGDAGSSLGAALLYLYKEKKEERKVKKNDSMKSAYLGPSFSSPKISEFLTEKNIPFKKMTTSEIDQKVAKLISEGNVIGWFQGRMEFGPRALGNRSIIGDPRIVDMQKKMNIKIKNRESFRPFAPVILDEFKEEYFGLKSSSSYMLITRNLSKKFLLDPNNKEIFKGIDKVNQIRSKFPAITHIDNSCRVQTIEKSKNPRFYSLLKEFYELTNCPILINTSFNVRGEPIVCNPEDALICFLNTAIDVLVLEDLIILKKDIKSDMKTIFPKPQTIED